MATVYETLTRQLLESEEGAFRIGIRPITGLTATQVQAALAELAATGGGIATVSSLGAVRISTSPQDPNSPVAVEVSEKAVPSGVATLDAGGKVPSAQLPPLAISDTFVVNTQSAMLALAAQVGDVAVRTDQNRSYILRAEPASTLSNWQELLTPTDAVLSVNGRTGAVAFNEITELKEGGVLETWRKKWNFTGAGVIIEPDGADPDQLNFTISGAAAGAATETAAGITEQATEAETQAGAAGNLFATVARLKAELDRRQTSEAWIAPTLLNSWTNLGAPYAGAGYYKDPLGRVHLRGVVKNGTSGEGVAIFILPTGYIPANRHMFASIGGANSLARIDVETTGRVSATVVSNNTFLSLDGISFRP